MHSLCFSGVHCIICDVRFQMEKNIQASETAGGASLAVDLLECSFFIILYSRAFVKYCEVSFWLSFCCIFTEKLILTPI